MDQPSKRKKNRSISHDLFYHSIFQGVPMLLGFFLLPLYSTYLSTAEYGTYSLAMATINILGILSINWVNVSSIRFYNQFQEEGESGKLMSLSLLTLLITTLLSSLLLVAIALGGILSFDHLSVILLMFVLMNLERMYMGYLQAARQVRSKAVLKILYTVIRFGITFVLLIFFEFNHLGIFIGNIGASLAIVILAVKLEPHRLKKLEKKDLKKIKEYWAYGYPFIWILGVHWILTASDRFMIEFIRDSTEVGIYALNYSLPEKILMPMITIFMGTAAPIVFQQVERGDREGAKHTLDSLFRVFLLLMFPAVVGLSAIRYDLGSLLIRNEFQEGIVILPIISLSLLFLGIRQYTNITLEIEKRSKEIASITLIVGGLNIVLNLIFISLLGYMGAAYATLISYIVYYLLSHRKAKKLTDIRVRFQKTHGKILLAALGMGLLISFSDRLLPFDGVLLLVSKIVIGVLSYGGLIFGMRVITLQEIRSIINKRRGGRR